MDKDTERKYIYVLKAFAILSVVSAHVAPVPDTVGQCNQIVSWLLNAYGTAGVPVFYIISGYLFYRNKKGIQEFWRTKFSFIIVPWSFCGTLLWLYVVLRKGGISIDSWWNFLLGVKTSLYYLTVLMVLYILYFKWKNKMTFVSLTMLLSVVSIVSTGWGTGLAFINEWVPTFYLNPLNWMLYFGVGLMIGHFGWLEQVARVCGKFRVLVLAAYVGTLMIHYKHGISWGYCSKWALINLWLQAALIFGMSWTCLQMTKCRILELTGKYSFSIYLLHQLGAGALVAVTSKLDVGILTLMRPFILIGGMDLSLFYLQNVFFRKKRVAGEKIMMLIGSRR